MNNFCYPSGRYDDTVISAVETAGYGAPSRGPGLATAAHPYILNRIEIQLSTTGSTGSCEVKPRLRWAPRRERLALGGKDGVRWLEAELPGALAAFSTRLGGVSEPPFDTLNLGRLTGDPAVRENRHRLAAALGIDPRGS